MYFIVLRRDDGQYELKLLQFGLGAAFHKGSDNYLARVQTRAKIIYEVGERLESKYESSKALSLAMAFGEIHACFESEADLPYVASLLEYDSLRPMSEREARSRQIADIFRSHLAVPDVAEAYIQIAQRCAFIFPDHVIAREIGNACSTIAAQSQDELVARRKIYMPLFQKCALKDKNDWFEKFTKLQRFYPARELAAAAEAWLALAAQTKEGPKKLAFLESFITGQENTYECLCVHAALVPQAFRYSLKTLKLKVRRAYLQFRYAVRNTDSLSLMVFQQALASGFDFGEQGRRNRAMLEERKQATESGLEKLRPQIAKQRKKAVKPVTQKGEGDGTEEALWAWPVDKVVDYMGPVGRKGSGRKKRKKSPQVQSETLTVVETEPTPIPSVPEQDEALVELGLRNSLGLLIEEAENALQHAKTMSIDSENIGQLSAGCLHMKELADRDVLPQDAVDDCLETVGELLDIVRSEIAQVQESNNLLEAFDEALMEACDQERAIYGKRYGGVIGCALTLNDWPLINANYHNRLISGCNWIRIGRQGRYLREDEAIVFYVTFTSLSGYAFDISAHLWRRYEDAGDVPPTLPSDGQHKPMDEENWYDTFIPCFVLHVPFLQ